MKSMVKFILFIIASISLFSSTGYACAVPARKLSISGSSLEKHPITIVGTKIYFDKGTSEEFHIQFDPAKKKWCTSISDVGCLLNLPSGNVLKLGNSEGQPLFVGFDGKDYAKIEINNRDGRDKMRIYALDPVGKKISSKYLELDDSSDDAFDEVKIISSLGADYTFQREKGSRGLIQVKNATEEQSNVLDLAKKDSKVFGCGQRNLLAPKTDINSDKARGSH